MTNDLERIIDALPVPLPDNHRFVVSIAGPPAAGKTTLAAELASALAPNAAMLGMDAFHFDDKVLDHRGHLDRKGAPHTFDVDGYRRTLSALRSEPDQAIAIPEFDRTLELTRGSARIVSPDQQILITEGNYLLLDEEPWIGLRLLFDLTVSLATTIETIEQRIMQRWRDLGFDTKEATRRLVTNDLPNARRALQSSRTADIVLTSF